MSGRTGGLLLAVLLAGAPHPLRCQAPRITVITRADLFAATRDIRRGIRENANIVGQLDAVLGLRRGTVSLTAGAWSEFEPRQTRSEPRPDLRAGPAGLSDWSTWLQLAAQPGDVVLSAGVIRNFYRRVGGDPAVTELYGTARLQSGRWVTGLSAWKATAGADGLYLEPSIGYVHFANPFTGPAVTWSSTLRAGFQVGPRRPEGGAKVPGPLGTGLTHIALGTSMRPELGLGPVALVAVLGAEAQINRDRATKLRRDGTRRGWLRLWAPLQLGLTYPARRRP